MSAKWILLVDDEEEIRASLRELLYVTFGEDELRIVEAHDGIEATGKIKNQKFDCIITDMRMPKKEGDAFIVSVRQNPFNDETPVIMLTGYPNKKILKQFRFVYLMEKPFLHNELTELVSTQLKIGNQGGRLAADMVNNLVDATKLFLTQSLRGEEVAIESPTAKRSGDGVEVEHMSQVNIYDNRIHNSFSLIVKESDLKKITAKFQNIDTNSLDKVGFALGQSILKYALKNMKNRGSINYNIVSYARKEAEDKLSPKRGIMIPINCGEVKIKILACGEANKKAA